MHDALISLGGGDTVLGNVKQRTSAVKIRCSSTLLLHLCNWQVGMWFVLIYCMYIIMFQ
jgi:hypothetical protein